jgi:hypothetical protein
MHWHMGSSPGSQHHWSQNGVFFFIVLTAYAKGSFGAVLVVLAITTVTWLKPVIADNHLKV